MEEIIRNEMLDNKEEEEDDVMLPGFRFHPTDEELVGFYLKRKIHHHPLSIELIKQLDIYKFDPWDLPKLATMGEKEWYFYCQRDRKYRNSTRPNRVTAAGFWKATGTDRPIYSSNSNGTKCIGLKKSLVFYKGRASKGVKTDWMMHEFRLPSLTQSTIASNKIPPNDSWAICKIFKKTNATTTQRAAISRSWPVSSLPLPLATISTSTSSNIGEKDAYNNNNHVTDITIPCNFGNSYGNPFDYFDFDGKLPQLSIPNEPFNPTFEYPPILEASDIAKSSLDVSSILLSMSSSVFGDFDSQAAAAAVAAAAEADSFLLNEMKDQTNFNEEINVLLAQHQNVNMNVSDPCQWEGGVSFNSIWENSF